MRSLPLSSSVPAAGASRLPNFCAASPPLLETGSRVLWKHEPTPPFGRWVQSPGGLCIFYNASFARHLFCPVSETEVTHSHSLAQSFAAAGEVIGRVLRGSSLDEALTQLRARTGRTPVAAA